MNYKKTTLKNGLRVITVPMKNTETVTVVVMVGVGSRYESEKEAGLSHFIEHMFFKGTQKRPTALAIASELDAIGGEYNAFTGKNKTGYYAKVDAKHIGTALEVVSDIYLNSKIDAEEIEREKGTIIQELNMYEDTPVRSVADLFEKLLYNNNPLGREIVGYKKTLEAFGRKNFVEYMKKYYVANDTVICVAGKFNERKITSDIEKIFLSMAKGVKPNFKKVAEKQLKPEYLIKNKKTEQTHLIIGSRAYDYNHRDRFALALLSVILGGNMSSRLFIEVRERRGLAYHVSTGVEAYSDCGYIATQAGVEHKNLKETVKIILAEYRKISRVKVGAGELKKAKEFIKGRNLINFESSDEIAMFFIDQELTKKKIMKLTEIFRKIEAVTADDILRVAKDVFQNKKLNLAVIGPHQEKRGINKILKI